MNINKKITLLSLGFILLIIIMRLLPHPPNFAPANAVALVVGLYSTKNRFGLFVPLIGVFLADIIIGFYSLPIMIAVYASYCLIYGIGWLQRTDNNVIRVSAATLGSSVLFFAITNYAVWQFGTMYEHTVSGLSLAYAMAIPFFRNTLASDALYTVLLVGVVELVPLFSKSYRLSSPKRESVRT